LKQEVAQINFKNLKEIIYAQSRSTRLNVFAAAAYLFHLARKTVGCSAKETIVFYLVQQILQAIHIGHQG